MKKLLKILIISILLILLTPTVIFFILYQSADMKEPELAISTINNKGENNYPVNNVNDTLFCKESYLFQDSSTGLWELYIKGSGQERGAQQGALTKDLMRYQEDVFIDKIKEIIPSDSYLSFLRSFLIVFNRNIGEHIPLEYREEIMAMSEFCTDEYNAIGTPYQRQLNYHAAHDIGHTMQQYMLVGCSSFGVWGDKSGDGELIVGRNFDFYVGDDFAKNKVITFAVPDMGYKYASIGWAGMIGVLSGINEKGLTVTINAAKGAIPTSAATPISILVREILQYASNIEEAYQIASAHKTFVSESILIGSLSDKSAAIIEKTPKQIALFEQEGDMIICTNHFQSQLFANDKYNVENIEFSDSKYRYDRLSELLNRNADIEYRDAISILRDRYGIGGEDVGISNEMTLNQSIAHHSVLFKPEESLMWVTTSPWQSGKIICYDLKSFFEKGEYPTKIKELGIAADSTFMANDYNRVVEYRAKIKEIKSAISSKGELSNEFISTFMMVNPNHYYTYRILGDYFYELGDNKGAIEYYNRSLEHQIPYKSERIEIEDLVKKINK